MKYLSQLAASILRPIVMAQNSHDHFLYPVIGPYGDPVTRRLATPADGREMDHHHHRSIWIGTRRSERSGTTGQKANRTGGSCTVTLNRSKADLSWGELLSNSDWVGMGWLDRTSGQKIARFWISVQSGLCTNTPSSVRIMDLHLTLTRPKIWMLLFGDTKEGGLASIRVEETMEVKRDLGGKIEKNGIGGHSMKTRPGGKPRAVVPLFRSSKWQYNRRCHQWITPTASGIPRTGTYAITD